MNPTRPAIFLDRDGTLIVDRVYLNDPDQIEYLPGVFEALRLLRDCGFVFCVATNQSGVARGLVDVRNLDEIHRRIRAKFSSEGVDILSFHSAPFMTDTDHPMRKPNPGMILEAARWHRLNIRRSWMIGDRFTDVLAGRNAGCRSVLLGHIESNRRTNLLASEIYAPNLLQAAEFIVEKSDSV